MKLRPFIFIYSAALLAWLGLTFVTPQSVQRYRPSAPTSAKTPMPKPADQANMAISVSQAERAASASR